MGTETTLRKSVYVEASLQATKSRPGRAASGSVLDLTVRVPADRQPTLVEVELPGELQGPTGAQHPGAPRTLKLLPQHLTPDHFQYGFPEGLEAGAVRALVLTAQPSVYEFKALLEHGGTVHVKFGDGSEVREQFPVTKK